MKPGLSTKKIITMGFLTVLAITLTTGLAAGTKLPTDILTPRSDRSRLNSISEIRAFNSINSHIRALNLV